MGAAGLTSSSFEMAGNSGTGIEFDLSQVPLREEGMTAYEILLSESQERMLFVVQKGHEEETLEILKKWGLDGAVIGQVIESPEVRINYQGEQVANLPISPVVDGASDLKRPKSKPRYLEDIQHLDLTGLADPSRGDEALKQLLASPNIASKEWVYEQYDHMVRLNTLVLPGSDAAVIRIPDSRKAVALSVDCNSRYCYLDPFEGAQIAVAECSRNIACSGAIPIGLTNCLNFGNPEKPEIMWQFEQSVLGIAQACKFFDIPVVSGNVSLYNETKGDAIYPTPTVAVVGLLKNLDDRCTQWFKNSGDLIGLLGLTLEEISGSEYLKLAFDLVRGKPPQLDKKLEQSVQELCLELIRGRLIHSAHDCSDGGLGVSAVESCITGPENVLGATLNLESTLRKDALLFGESQSRILVSFAKEQRESIAERASKKEVPFAVIGEVGGSRFSVNINGGEFIRQDIQALKNIWKNVIGNYARQVS